ncbi:MAG: hypothetical protein RJB13_1324 [Pseudomonadota bacterium]
MVRSSSTKASKEKSSGSQSKTAAASKKAATKAKPKATKAAAKSPKSASAADVKKKVTAAAASEKKSTKAAATQTKRAAGASKEPASVKKTSQAEKSAKSKSARANQSPKKAPVKKQITQELFDLNADIDTSDTPVVSVLPQLNDISLDPSVADQRAKTPPEFMDSPVPSHAVVPAAKGKSAAPKEVSDEEIEKVTFSYLGFNDDIIAAVQKQNYKKPTRVQALCLPHTLDGKDVAGFAQTGTGKTAVYLLTAAQKLLKIEDRKAAPHKPFVLVLVPTRELADQVAQDAKKLFSDLKIKSLAVFGGVDVERHANELNQAVDLVVATPGRLLDLHRSKRLELDHIQLLVIDECDRMFDMGFIDDVEYVLRHLPNERVQKLLFSATGSEKVKELAFEYLEQPEYIETDPVRITPERISQTAYAVTAEHKFLTLMGHIKDHNPECAIIFTNTKVVAEWIGYKLACNGLEVEVLTGDIPQRKRMSLIKKIKDGKCNLLVATDVLSRGLHVANLSHVYNFDIPDDSESFIHRIGRTARAGATGHAISLICEDYGYNMGGVEKLLGFKIPLMPVPASYLSAEDKSDYPFDANGRVKSYGQSEAMQGDAHQTADGTIEQTSSKPDFQSMPQPNPKHAGERTERIQERPEPTIQQPRREAGGAHAAAAPHGQKHRHPQTDQKHPTKPTQSDPGMPVAQSQRSTAGSSAQNQHAKPTPVNQGMRSAEPRTPVTTSQGHTAHHRSAPLAAGSHQQSRDERAKETIEMAILAAKKAAARRQEQSKSGSTLSGKKRGVPRVTEHIDEFASAVITGAQEKLGGAFGSLQEKFVSRFEENFPKLSETLIRLGFFSKRFTDEG